MRTFITFAGAAALGWCVFSPGTARAFWINFGSEASVETSDHPFTNVTGVNFQTHDKFGISTGSNVGMKLCSSTPWNGLAGAEICGGWHYLIASPHAVDTWVAGANWNPQTSPLDSVAGAPVWSGGGVHNAKFLHLASTTDGDLANVRLVAWSIGGL